MGARIEAIEYYLPATVLTNEMLAATAGTTSEAIYKTSGVRQRHVATLDVTPSDLAVAAAEKLFTRFPERRSGIDALLFVTEGLDYKAPVTACLIHRRLELPAHCLALDIPGGCTGFIHGLLLAKSLINSHQCQTVLLLTAETVSKVLHDEDFALRALFGDGAAATLITASDTEQIGQFITGTDGTGEKALWVEHSGFRAPADITWLQEHQTTTYGMRYGRLHMQGDEIMHFALTHVPDLIAKTLAANPAITPDFYLFHQASHIILKALQRKCRIPKEQFIIQLENTGNTVSSSLPIALGEALGSGQVHRGQHLLLAGFGVGFSWGATLIKI